MEEINNLFLQININKKQLGQFYTTNYEYILQNLNIPRHINHIIEPFAGNGDLIEHISEKEIECYDIDPKKEYIKKRDTLLNPPNYNNKFIITNPPYLARNKSKNKYIFDKYNQNDLYKCLISELLSNKSNGGILIIPLNFWCSIRKNDILLRKRFLNTYNILLLNVFEEQVFDDTSYTICSFQFELIQTENINTILCNIYPSKLEYNFSLNNQNNYTIGGEIYNLPQNKKIKIERLTKNNIDNINKTNILVKCIDNNLQNKIQLSIVDNDNIYIDNTDKLSARSYATLIITPKISLEKQQQLVNKFNIFLNTQRKKYNSLFLTNYRESNTISRKRISFNLVFQITNYLLNDMNQS